MGYNLLDYQLNQGNCNEYNCMQFLKIMLGILNYLKLKNIIIKDLKPESFELYKINNFYELKLVNLGLA